MTDRANPTDVIQDELREALTVGERFLDKCFSAWSCGEPEHRVRTMLDAADAFRAKLNEPAVQTALQAAQHRQEDVAGMREALEAILDAYASESGERAMANLARAALERNQTDGGKG